MRTIISIFAKKKKKNTYGMCDRALNALMFIGCLLNGKKYNLRLGKVIEKEDKYVHEVSRKLPSLHLDSWH